MKPLIISALLSFTFGPVFAADLVKHAPPKSQQQTQQDQYRPLPIYTGRVAVMDGRTLWFPAYAERIRLADIDTCELPQWSLASKWENQKITKAPPPVPCGPFAKAWLKRTIGQATVTCSVVGYDLHSVARAKCFVGRSDIALEMLRIGWARVDSPFLTHPQYMSYQNAAMSARYGIWATYVLDMNEWRRKAIDKTLNRQPIADFNLLLKRESEISPPFADARRKPKRTDR